MKLITKLWLLIIASSIIGLTIFVGLTLIIGTVLNEGYVSQDLNQLGHQVVEEAEAESSQDQIIVMLERTVVDHPKIDFEWVTPDGILIYATSGRTENYEFSEMIHQFLNMPFSLWERGLNATLLFTWGEEQDPQYLIMKVPNAAMRGSQVEIYVREYSHFLQLIIPLLLFLVTPYIFSLLFFTRVNRRLKKLTKAMNDVDAEKSTISVKDKAKDEIGQLSRHFNSMSKRISDQVSQIQEFESNKKTLIANISHDLRTPMTMIQGYAETLHEGVGQDEQERKTYTDIILRRSRYMDQLLQKLLEISNLDSKKGNIQLKESNVSEHLRKIAADYVHTLESKGMEFDIQIPDHPIYALTDPYLFERATRNLIENAIQYGSSGQYLGIALEKLDDQVRIQITDHGQGIPKEQISLIFERFYRGSDARQGDGMGIGLSIVREIADAHKGKIQVDSIPNENTVFTFVLPMGEYRPSSGFQVG